MKLAIVIWDPVWKNAWYAEFKLQIFTTKNKKYMDIM